MNHNFSSMNNLLEFPVEILFQIFENLKDRFGLLRCVSNDVKQLIDSMTILLAQNLSSSTMMTMIETEQFELLRFFFDPSNKSHQSALNKLFAFKKLICVKFTNTDEYFIMQDWWMGDPDKPACLIHIPSKGIKLLTDFLSPISKIQSATYESNCIKLWDGLSMHENRFSINGKCDAKKLIKNGERWINMYLN